MYRDLFEIAKAIQRETDYERLTSMLLERAILFTKSARGFIVVREASGYEEKYNIHFDRTAMPLAKRRFSRSLVREAIKNREIISSRDLSADDRFAKVESVRDLGASPVLVVPLRRGADVHAVIYLEKQENETAYASEDMAFAGEFAEVAGLSIELAIEREALRRFKHSHEPDLFDRFDFGRILTRHPKMLELLETVAQVADSDATVLIRGATGTGKELIAHALYRNSPRRHKPFIILHCGALPESLLEAELFGHTRGAFTGARGERTGRIAAAAGGTLFIDEVAEIPLGMQAKLLRFFQSGEFQRLGSDRTQQVDVRIIAATHQNLADMVARGDFRQDLYYRIKVVELELPPLRERKGDIDLLVDFFFDKFWKRKGERPQFTSRAIAALHGYDFPGNIRELGHLIERICLLAKGPRLGLAQLPPEVRQAYQNSPGHTLSGPGSQFEEYSNQELKDARIRATRAAASEVERLFLKGLMARHQGRIAEAAAAAGMQRTYLYKLLTKLGMRG